MVWKIILVLVVIQLILTLGHVAVFMAMRKFLGIEDLAVQQKLKIIFLILSLLPLIASVLVNNFIGSILNGFYYISAVWLGTFHWLCFAGIFSWVVYFIVKTFGINLPNQYIGLVLFPLAVLISIYGLYNTYQTQVTSYTVKMHNLPDFWQGKKVVFLSDTHLGNVRGKSFITKIAKMASAQNPEIILIPGDFFDGPPADYEALAKEFMKNTNPNIKVYFSNGNHEEFRQNELYLSGIRASGMKILNNQKDEVNGLQILGTDYFGNGTNEGLQQTLAKIGVEKNKPSILLKHAPNALLAASEAGVDLTVSGHTHKGQMWPYGYITKAMFKGYDYGQKAFGDMQVITSSGAGTWGPPQRVGTKSEIVSILLEKK